MAKGLVDAVRNEFAIEDVWRNYEIHPDFSPRGTSLTDLFDPCEIEAAHRTLEQISAGLPVSFAFRDWSTNSRLANLACEFARDAGRFHQVHEALFRAYFADLANIGERAVVLAVCGEAGLDRAALAAALDDGRHLARLEAARALARERGVTAVPTFFFEDGERITGALPLERFRAVLRARALSPL